MKNKYIKRTYFLEYKYREVLRFFCADLKATQIAKLANANRNLVNR